jgi:FKBP-type peptidyl-prolyl cis-trans isomerase
MLRTLKNTWRKFCQRIPAQDTSRLRDLDNELSAVTSQKQSVLAELQRVQGEIDSFKTRDAELAALNERIAAMDAAGEAAGREIAELRECMADAAARQETTDRQLRLLREQQESERREHQSYVQESMAREHRQNRRLGWTLLLACCALLLGTLAGSATIVGSRQYAGLLAELSRDIKDIKASMERQAAARQEQSAAASPAIAAIPESTRENAEATTTDQPDAVRKQPDIASTVTHYHPHNKYRNRKEMRAFFNENAGEPGVFSVADGLQYRIVDQGAGKSPGAADTVILDYSAFLLDGTQLFSSYDEPLPVQFSVSQLVPGLREVVQRMAVGARWEVYVSPDHAYRGGVRKRKKYGYEPLLYVVELRSIIDAGDLTL